MPTQLTKDEFVKKAIAKHGDQYDYTDTVYVRTKDKVEIVCRDHGPFWQQPGNHLQGQGCYKCRNLKIGSKLSSNTDTFVQKCKAVHGDLFDYSNVSYKNNATKITIGCSLHGNFEQVPAAHLAGNGCPVCRWDKIRIANTSNTANFLVRAKAVHGDRYDYSRVQYINYFEKVEIGCPEHGFYWQVAGFHTSMASGCPACAQGGFKFDRQGILYVLESENITKVGITNLRGKDRATYINNRSSHDFTVRKEYVFEDGGICNLAEDKILALLREQYKNPVEKFHGYTESFCDVDRVELLQILDKIHSDLSDVNKLG